MQYSVAVRNTVIAVIVLATLYLVLFEDLSGKIKTLHSDVMEELKVSSPLHTEPPLQTTPPPNLVEDAEKWKNFFLINNIPIG
jgi:hypothetical protein